MTFSSVFSKKLRIRHNAGSSTRPNVSLIPSLTLNDVLYQCKECECDPVSWVCESCPAKYLCDDCNEDNHSKPDKKGHKRRTYDPDAEKKKAENSEPQAPSTTAQNQTKQASTAAIAVPEKIPKICVSCETDDVEFVCYTCTAERFLCEDCNSVKHGPKSDHDVRKSTDPPPPPPPQQQQQQQHEEKKVVDEKASAPTNQLQPGTQSVDHNAGAGNPKATVPPANYPSNFAARYAAPRFACVKHKQPVLFQKLSCLPNLL
eukprot:jgi/Bigna1/76703/fgenesh1_pg.43_\